MWLKCDWQVTMAGGKFIQLKRRWHAASQEMKVDTKMCVWKEIKKERGMWRWGWKHSEKVEV